jgi:outer membrane protein assembly factor BamB
MRRRRREYRLAAVEASEGIRMHRISVWAVLLACLGAIPMGAADWVTHSGDFQRTGWQKSETKISKDTLKNLQLLWKIKLETRQRSVYSLYGPLIVERTITDRGFKEIAFVAGANNDLFAVDADLGKLLWKKHFDWHAEVPETEQATFLCPGGLTAWPVLQPAPQRGRGPGAPAAPARARGVAPAAPGAASNARGPERGGGGGPFAIRAIYVLPGDGDLHAVNINTGGDLTVPMRFLPPNGKPYSLALVDNVIYTITGQGCGGTPNSVYSLDLADPAKTVRSWRSGSGGLWGTAGPAIGSDGTIYAETGDGQYDPALNRYANSIVALTPKELKLKDWYTPSNAEWLWKRDLDMNVTPVVFPYKGRDLIVGSGKEGRFFMLESTSLGGSDHRTPLFRSDLISNEEVDFAGAGTWGSLATWEDAAGARWVLAPVWGPKHPNARFPLSSGETNVGTIAAFKVEERNGKPVLTNAWTARNMVTPAAPAVTNGLVFALATGEWVRQANDKEGGLFQADVRAQKSAPAVLYVLDAATGKELWSSGNQVTSFTHNGELSIANGRVYFTTFDNTLYCFGIPMEH